MAVGRSGHSGGRQGRPRGRLVRGSAGIQDRLSVFSKSYRPINLAMCAFLLTGLRSYLRAQTAMPCIGPSTAFHPAVEHDASWSDPVERLVLRSHDRVDGLYKVA